MGLPYLLVCFIICVSMFLCLKNPKANGIFQIVLWVLFLTNSALLWWSVAIRTADPVYNQGLGTGIGILMINVPIYLLIALSSLIVIIYNKRQNYHKKHVKILFPLSLFMIAYIFLT